eukprot:g18204.t2
MAPLDICTGGGGGGGGGGNDGGGGGGGGMVSFEHGRTAARHSSCEDARRSVGAAKESKEPPPSAETAGERRKSRAAKLRQSRSRNAARIQQQAYTSAEDSEEEEEEDVKPDLAMLQAEAQLGPGVDKQAWKKQQRMIRNRESAALSRKRKRDRIESLEEQVARLVEENRGLKHRLAKYEASPQQARYKYARQSAPPHSHSAGPRQKPLSSATSGGRRNGSNSTGPAAGPPAGRNQGSGGAAAAFEGRDGGCGSIGGGSGGGGNCGKSSTSTATSVDPTTTAVRSADGAQPPASSSAHAMKLPKKYQHPVAAADSSPCNPTSEGDRPSSMTASVVSPDPAPGAAAAAPPMLPNLVKMEVSSDCEGGGGSLAWGGAAAAVVDGGYSSSSTADDTLYASEEEQLQVLSSDGVDFDKDDNAACDRLLRDILGQQDDSGEDDEFLSLLSDGDMGMTVVNSASEDLNEGFVKRELQATAVSYFD